MPTPQDNASPGPNLARMVFVLAVTVGGGLAMLTVLITRTSNELVYDRSVNDAALMADAISEFRGLYTTEVVNRLDSHVVAVTHDYEQRPAAIPLPATLAMRLAERLGRNQDSLSMRLYSPYPFPWRAADGGLRDSFETRAWQTLSQDPSGSFSSVEQVNGQTILRYAIADVLQPACVGCHNSHPDSPKTDWQPGDLRGVLEVGYPVGAAMAKFESTRWMMYSAVGALAFILFVVLGVMLSRLYNATRAAGLSNRELSMTLALAHEQRDALLSQRALTQQSERALQQSNEELQQHTRELQAARTASLNIMQDMELARATAEAGDRAKSVFLANMSHELRTPMNGVLGMIDLVRDEPLSQHQQQLLDTARASGDHLLKLLNEVLDLSKVDAGELALERLDTDVYAIIESALEALGAMFTDKALHLGLIAPADFPNSLYCDPTRLQQVLLNLIGNAIKFTESGSVTVRLAQARDRFEIAVADTGIGISAEAIQRIFEPFAQADESTTRRFGGSGLGLALTQRLIDAMQGTLSVASAPGQGSVFTVNLPLERGMLRARQDYDMPEFDTAGLGEPCSAFFASAVARLGQQPVSTPVEGPVWHVQSTDVTYVISLGDVQTHFRKPLTTEKLRTAIEHLRATPEAAPEPIESKPATPANPVEPNRTRILVVEDNEVNQKVVSGFLRRLHITPDIAEDGIEALARATDQPYDLIFMDCHMPRMDGFLATRKIREMETTGPAARTPIIALTAGVLPEDVQACLDAGMDAHLAKPVRADQLRECIERWLG